MRKISIMIFFLLSLFCHAQKGNENSALEKKLDSLLTLVKELQKKGNDSTLIKIDKLDEVFKKSEPKWPDKFLPAIIALFTVLISSSVAYYVGIRSARTQITNAETQARTQIAIAADQLEVSRKQIEQNTKNTLAQIRANNISKARIEWIQNLRPILSEYFGNIPLARSNFEDLYKAVNEKSVDKIDSMFEKIELLLHKIQIQDHQIRLFLSKTELKHQKLEQSMSEYLKTVTNAKKEQPIETGPLEENVLNDAREVLKDAWEQAKSETEIE